MSDPSSNRPSADRNLLFGLLALQLDFISRDALLAALQAWVLDKGKALARILQDQGQLASDRLVLLNALIAVHLKGHQNNPRHSLEAVAVPSAVRQQLESLRDGDVQASLALVGSGDPTNPEATGPHAARQEDHSAELRYRIVRPHAKGGLGQVLVAEDQELHREVALKEIQQQYAHDPRSCRRFLLEAEITGGLEHPGIVPVYGLGQYADGRPFYVMRFVKGDSLQEAIQRFHSAESARADPGERSLALRRLLGRFVDVCQAVAYAHSRGVLHRDLKPGNILLGKYGETLVVDWSLARTVGCQKAATDGEEQSRRPSSGSGREPTQMGSAIGTPAYMSPEQSLGQVDQLSTASDVYSLGATLYTLVTGRPPFEGKEVRDILRQVQEGQVVSPRQVNRTVPPALAAICLKAMARRPEARYASALDLAADVEHWLAEEPVTAQTEPLRARAWRWVRRHQALVSGGAAALVVGVVFLGVLAALLTRQNGELDQANVRERQALEELAQKQEALAQANDRDRRANAELDEKNRDLEQANASERAANEELVRKNEALAQAQDRERQANAELALKNQALAKANANERAAREELARKHQALTQAHDKERRANAELDKKNRSLEQAHAKERAAKEELTRKNETLLQAHAELHEKNQVLAQAHAKERAAKEELTRKQEALTQAHAKERRANVELHEQNQVLAQAHAKERAATEESTRKNEALLQANQAVVDDLTSVADDYRLKQADMSELRKKLLQAAMRFYAKLLDHATGPDRERYRVRRTLSLAHLGDHAQAVGEVSALTKTKDVTANHLYDLACVCALASAAVRQDDKLPEADREKLSEEYAVRALDLLKQAAAAGHFNRAASLEQLKKAPDLDVLRPREDFNRWLDELEKSKDK